MHNYLHSEEGDDNSLTRLARNNRRARTDAEAKMWRLLRDRRFAGFKFRRQHQLLRYIVDFACIEKRLIIELDGGGHAEPEKAEEDRRRTEGLCRVGFRVLRFWNHEVLRDSLMVREEVHRALHGEETAHG